MFCALNLKEREGLPDRPGPGSACRAHLCPWMLRKGAPATDQITVLLDWNPNTNYSGLFVARIKVTISKRGSM